MPLYFQVSGIGSGATKDILGHLLNLFLADCQHEFDRDSKTSSRLSSAIDIKYYVIAQDARARFLRITGGALQMK